MAKKCELSKADAELIRGVMKKDDIALANMARFMGQDPSTLKLFLRKWDDNMSGVGGVAHIACDRAEQALAVDVPRYENSPGALGAGRRRRAFLQEQRRPCQSCDNEEFAIGQELRLTRAEEQHVIDARRIELLEGERSKAAEQQERDAQTIRQLRREIEEGAKQRELYARSIEHLEYERRKVAEQRLCIEQLQGEIMKYEERIRLHEVTINRLQREHEDQSATYSQAIDQLRRELAEADEHNTRSSQAMKRMQ
jgi:hypothetical protein